MEVAAVVPASETSLNGELKVGRVLDITLHQAVVVSCDEDWTADRQQ